MTYSMEPLVALGMVAGIYNGSMYGGVIPAILLRSSLIGIGVGILPEAGGNIAAFLSYNAAKNSSGNPGSFGKGNPAGVAAATMPTMPRQ